MHKCIIYAIINPTNPSCWFTYYPKRNHDNMLWDSDIGKELTGYYIWNVFLDLKAEHTCLNASSMQ